MVDPQKYALVERERRWLVPTLPGDEPWAVRRIEDLYIAGSRLRLRRSRGHVEGAPESRFTLTQKVAGEDRDRGRQGLVTTIYLTEAEHEVFDVLPGERIAKTRLSFPPLGVDLFEGALDGLIIAEAEFVSDEEMAAFRPPAWCGTEITGDPSYRGSCLAGRG